MLAPSPIVSIPVTGGTLCRSTPGPTLWRRSRRAVGWASAAAACLVCFAAGWVGRGSAATASVPAATTPAAVEQPLVYQVALTDEQEFLKEAARGALSRLKTVEAAREALDGGGDFAAVTGAARDAAAAGATATIPMLATKGRSSYLGERSIGHQDPGATSAALLLEILADVAGSLNTSATNA